MTLYDAVGLDDFEPKASRYITELSSNTGSELAYSPEEGEVEPNFMTRRGLGILNLVSKRGYRGLLVQLKEAMQQSVIVNGFEGIVLQLVPSSRWEKKYGKKVYDIILAVPEWSKVIALSTTELESVANPYEIKRFENLSLSNFYLYPFFNRAKGVKGRSVEIIKNINSPVVDTKRFSFLLRTCNDAQLIGRSAALSSFTPLETIEGLRLGFYFGVVCKIHKVESVLSPSGFGFMLGQSKLTLSDPTGSMQCYLSTDIFRESIIEAQKQESIFEIKDPFHLNKYPGLVLLMGVWFLGDSMPYVAFIFFLGNNPDLSKLHLVSYMNTRLKMRYDPVVKEWSEKLHGAPLNSISGLVRDGEWLYYIKENWPVELFIESARQDFNVLSFSETLKLKIDRSEYKKWLNKHQTFFRANPNMLRLYTSRDPYLQLLEMVAPDLGRPVAKSPELNPGNEYYRCPKCGTTYKPSNIIGKGRLKFCKCGKRLKFVSIRYQKDQEPKKKKHKSNWSLGTDSWLRSISD
jgi:hypothetical protein